VDRAKPSDAPIITDPAIVARQPPTAYVLLRPTGDLADAVDGWRGEVLDRLGGVVCALPTAHVTLKAFGSSEASVTAEDERRILDVVAAWAAETPPLELRASGLALFDGEDAVPVALLEMHEALRDAIRDLWRRCAEAGLPAGYSDDIGADGWLAHVSLCYPDERPKDSIWEPLRTWTRYVEVGDARSTALEAEVVAFGDGTERRPGRYPFTR
jgi:2'-5' RNA ligase